MLEHRSSHVIRRIALAVGAMCGAGLLTTAPAAASVQVVAPAREATAAHEGQSPTAKPRWRFYDDYWTYDGCVAEGERGLDRRAWKKYQCRPSAVDWNLWVLRG